MNLTANDKRVLRAVDAARGDFDGFAPHGSADWTGIGRLQKFGLVEGNGFGMCETCRESHETQIFVLITPIALGYL